MSLSEWDLPGRCFAFPISVMSRRLNSLILFAFAVGSPVSAELISFEFTGKVGAEVIDPLLNFPTITVGTEVRGTLQYDTDIPETFGGIDPAYGFYDATPPFDVLSITVGDTTFSGSSLLPPTVIVANDIQDPVVGGTTDLFSVVGDIVSVSAEFDGLMTAIGIGMLSTDLDALESSALPEFFDFELFEFSSFFLDGLASSGETIEIIGTIDSLQRAGDQGRLLAGDADQDGDFDQLDLVQVSIAGKYLTGRDATWGEGDWDAEPAGALGNPRDGDGVFNQIDIVAALKADAYLTGPYAARIPVDASAQSRNDIFREGLAHTSASWTTMPHDLRRLMEQVTPGEFDDAAPVETLAVPEPATVTLVVASVVLLSSLRFARWQRRRE